MSTISWFAVCCPVLYILTFISPSLTRCTVLSTGMAVAFGVDTRTSKYKTESAY